MNELIITNYKNSLISAVYEDKSMVQVSACRKKTTACIGNIYVGRVDNIVKNINAAFVNISENTSCYLDLENAGNALFVKKQSEKKICIGDELIVQIAKEEVKTKAPVITANFSLTGKYVVLVHGGKGIQISKKITRKSVKNAIRSSLEVYVTEKFGIVARTNAQYASEEELHNEVKQLLLEYERISTTGLHQTKYTLIREELPTYLQQLRDSREFTTNKVVTNLTCVYKEFKNYLEQHPVKCEDGSALSLELVEDANELVIRYRINHFMDKALHRMLYLNSGATIVIDPTEALTVIDVNTGKAVTGKKATEETFFKINMEAAREIALQIRLRNLSGIILIDFINMEAEENKEALKEELQKLFKQDSIQTEVVDITKLGLMEITRKKVYKTLAEQLTDMQ